MKQPPVITVQLVHLHGPMKGQIQEYELDHIAIGRHPSCQLRFPADLAIISRMHAEIQRDGNRFKLVDHSANGTFVNGKRVSEAYLQSGDVLAFAEGGPKVSFLIQMREERPDTPPRRPDAAPVEAQPAPPQPAKKPAPGWAPTPSAEPPRIVKPEAPSEVPTVNAPMVFQYGPTLRSFKQVPVTVGKHPNCQMVINHPAVYDMHAQFFFHQNSYWVKDLTGRGQVLVNGQAIALQAPLNMNDLVSLGTDGPAFRFLGEGRMAEAEAQAPEQAPAPDSRSGASPRDKPEGVEQPRERKPFLRRFIP
ncbi:MAG: FHA domain-containing protein [Syntrophobacteraceae bacterium]|jgi:pSer/pThr/pTyr-binding forkhead associated (FHA) protein|nr:FHA domain-containing protein [Syntrophobacteraceae bacterium]